MSVWPDWSLYVPATYKNNPRRAHLQNSIRDISQEIFAAISGYGSLGPKTGVIWRGQANIDWRVTSKLGRAVSNRDNSAPLGDQYKAWVQHEKEMLKEVRIVGPEQSHHNGDLELLARLRHHGAATRLIDFTRDPLVALWFACNFDDTPSTDSYDGVLVAADRSWFHDIKEPWKFQLSKVKDQEDPYLFTLPSIDPRITAQRGLFVFASSPWDIDDASSSEFGNRYWADWPEKYEDLLAQVCERSVKWSNRRGRPKERYPQLIAVKIPREVKPELRRVLETTYGLSRTTMYPDFAGLGKAFADVTQVQGLIAVEGAGAADPVIT